MYKVEYQQHPDGTHAAVCIADEHGNWVADCGPEGNPEAEENAATLVKRYNLEPKERSYLSLAVGIIQSIPANFNEALCDILDEDYDDHVEEMLKVLTEAETLEKPYEKKS